MALDTLEDCRSALFTSYNNAFNENDDAGTDISAAFSDFMNVVGINVWLYKTVEHLLDGVLHLHKVFDDLLKRDTNDTFWYLPPHTLDLAIDTFMTALTWESIVEAWAKADLEGVKWTVGFIDYMRLAVWNEPYEMKFSKSPAEFWK